MYKHKYTGTLKGTNQSGVVLAKLRIKILSLHKPAVFQLCDIHIYIQTASEVMCLFRRLKIHSTSGERVNLSKKEETRGKNQ